MRSLVVASVLLFLGVAGRLALWPFTAWITQTTITAPPAASAIAQSAWSVLAIVLLYRVMPIFVASNQQTLQALLAVCAVARRSERRGRGESGGRAEPREQQEKGEAEDTAAANHLPRCSASEASFSWGVRPIFRSLTTYS